MIYEHKTLFLDIETSGIPRIRVPGVKPGTTKWKDLDYKTEYMDFPHIVSIAWAINDGDPVYRILNQEGREIPKDATDIHGITTEMANESKSVFEPVILGFLSEVSDDVDIVVGHGLYFDTSIVKANVLRSIENKRLDQAEFEDITEILHKNKRIDTMRKTAKMMGKWPTLSELYMKLFRKGFQAHSAKEDVIATRRCYEWLLGKRIVPTFDELQEKAKEKEMSA